ncbi:MAG: hypothetical protein J6328_07665 [Bacilli bacterium]|nr:hypothetical protein [Bacilli bacterium]
MIVLACEGNTEVDFIDSLIKKGYPSFSDRILMDGPWHIRQLKDVKGAINALPINEEITVYRIGDTLRDELSLKGFELRAERIKIHKVCTKPEIEVLMIIDKGDYNDFMKSGEKPKTYCRVNYPNEDTLAYLTSHDMRWAIKEYARIKRHQKNEHYLIDLLNHTI